ncbi:hypothetical protein [Anaerovibrio slackiae]|jgi:hypothetical protein|uniref:hypothetical protein n=1 Tax=Anaerovibrio slackiae TaxID=2652309 RepID=UPI00386F67A9
MTEVRNLDNKRICDKSSDERMIFIQRKDCLTIIQAKPDGTLLVTQQRRKKTS